MSVEGHSYQGQDRFVIEVLGGMRGGFFLDSGASDGRSGSNSKLLEDAYGWSGICVEPNASMFVQLRRNRGCICVSCCLYDRAGPVEFFEAAGVYGGIVEKYEPGLLRQAEAYATATATGAAVSKDARTVGSVLRECGAPPVIDYWSLDTEGSELAILRSFPFGEYLVRVLTVEHNSSPAREPIRAFLQSVGYRRVGTLGIDDCYVLESMLPRAAWRSRAFARARAGAR